MERREVSPNVFLGDRRFNGIRIKRGGEQDVRNERSGFNLSVSDENVRDSDPSPF